MQELTVSLIQLPSVIRPDQPDGSSLWQSVCRGSHRCSETEVLDSLYYEAEYDSERFISWQKKRKTEAGEILFTSMNLMAPGTDSLVMLQQGFPKNFRFHYRFRSAGNMDHFVEVLQRKADAGLAASISISGNYRTQLKESEGLEYCEM